MARDRIARGFAERAIGRTYLPVDAWRVGASVELHLEIVRTGNHKFQRPGRIPAHRRPAGKDVFRQRYPAVQPEVRRDVELAAEEQPVVDPYGDVRGAERIGGDGERRGTILVALDPLM